MDKALSVKLLNDCVADEILAIHQYSYFHFVLEDQGLGPLANLFRTTARREMQHLEMLSERILFLGGEVEMTVGGPDDEVKHLRDPEEMLKHAATLEERAAETYNNSARACGENSDAGSKELFETLIADEEKHFDDFDRVIDNIQRFGPNYLALQTMGGAEPEPGE